MVSKGLCERERAAAVFVAACALVTLGGCGGTPTAAPSSGAASAAAAPASPKPAAEAEDPKRPGYIRLLAPGAEPRRALRYRYQAGRHDVLTMLMRMQMSLQAGTAAPPTTVLPPMRSTLVIDSESVSPEGNMTYRFKVAASEVVPTPGIPDQLVKAMTIEMDKITGLSGRATVTPRGLTKDTSFEAPPGANAQVAELLENLEQQLQQMSAPLPEEPVGVGAKWQRVSPLKTRALTMEQTVTYTLAKLAGDKGTFAIEINQTAAPQPLTNQRLPPGATAKLDSLVSTGTGNLDFSLDHIIPKSHIKTSSVFNMTAEAKGETLPMIMKMGLEIEIDEAAASAATQKSPRR